jgi:hypothetical protein
MSTVQEIATAQANTTILQTTNTGVGQYGIVYNRMRQAWLLPETLMGGTRAMRLKGKEFLPQHPMETEEAYRNRLIRTVLRNYFRRTVTSLVGKVFAKGVNFDEDVPEDILEWAENIDLTGTHLENFARDVFKDAIAMGISYILVDYPTAPGAMTLEQEKAKKLRPYLVHVKAKNLTSFDSVVVGGIHKLTEVRIREEIIKDQTDNTQITAQRERILRPGSYELWEQENSNWTKIEEGTTSLDFITLIPIYTEKVNFFECEPPLEDLAWMNLEHWQVRSDQRTSLSFASFAILAASGWTKDTDGEISFGPNKVLTTQDPAGKFYYVESGGAHLAAGQDEIKQLEDQMRLFGLQFEQGGSAKQTTATEKLIDTSEGVAPLHTWANNLKDGIETAFMYMYQWVGKDPKTAGSVELDPDFGLSTKDTHDIDTITAARKNGDLPRGVYLEELKIKGVLNEDFDVQETLDLLDEEQTANLAKFDAMGGNDTLTGGQDTTAGGGNPDTVVGGNGNQQ